MAKNSSQSELLDIFNLLLKHFGPMHWWPAQTPLEVVFGCILTQNVSWKNVEQAIFNLKEENLINIDRILTISDTKLAELIKTTRYYQQKAASLKNFCSIINRDFNRNLDNLFNLEIKELRRTLLSMKGIGNETADSIILYAANKSIFVIDAYTKRIFSRMDFLKPNVNYDEAQNFFMSFLPPELYLFNEYHALIVSLGHNYCKTKKPICSSCPLTQICPKNFSK